MSKFIDLTGKRFARLIVIEKAKSINNGIVIWKCKCDCGNETFVRGNNLKTGAVKSCGCLKKISHTQKHNMSKTKIYRTWASMKNRCCNPNTQYFKNYGGRGINVCKEWMESFESFRNWAYTNGYSDDLTIERIDNNGNYCPENCTWIPLSEQAKNRRNGYSITYKNKTQNLKSWCDELNLDYKMIHNRIYKLNWSFERAIQEPVHINRRKRKE